MKPETHAGTRILGFLLLPNFALMSYASATEPLRAANLIARTELYATLPLSVDGVSVPSSAGVEVACEDVAAAAERCDALFVVAGGNPADWIAAERIYPALRRLARRGLRIGGISSGTYVLAGAGLLDGRDFTIHWEHAPALREAYPHLQPRQARYVLDGDRMSCGGGVAPLDMMHALIAERMGGAFARRVSDWYLHAAVADPAAPQRGPSVDRFGTHHPLLLAVLEKMETAIEQPLDRSAMARLVGLSCRHLDRLFADELGLGFAALYRRIRLEHARKLIEQSAMSLAEIAFATGFSSASHFSRAFRLEFGRTPASIRPGKSAHRAFAPGP